MRVVKFNNKLVTFNFSQECKHRRDVYYRSFMNEIYNKCHIRYEIEPIQHLAQFHRSIVDILTELENNKAPKKEIKAVRKADADMKLVMEKINTMRNLSGR